MSPLTVFCRSFINLQLGLHHICTRLYFLPLKTLHVLYESTLTLHFTDVGSPEHRLQGILLDISSNRLFKAVRICDSIETNNQPFLKIKFTNKGINTLNLSAILNQKSVQSNIPPYFEYKELPCISYSYTSVVATKIFNYKTSLQQIEFQSLSQNPLPCSCSEFLYAPCGHIVTVDLSILRNDKLQDLLRKGPKYREPVSFPWHQNFNITMDSCEGSARRSAKKEDVELDTLSKWIKSIGDVLKRRIRWLKHSVNTRHESIFSDPGVVTHSLLSCLHENFVIVPADKASNNYTFVCKRYYVDILIEELGLHLLPGSPKYNLTDFSSSAVSTKNGNRRYKFLVLGREGPLIILSRNTQIRKTSYTEDDIIINNMLWLRMTRVQYPQCAYGPYC